MSRHLPGLHNTKTTKVKKSLATSETYFLWAISLAPLVPLVSVFIARAARKNATDASQKQLASVAFGTAIICFLLQTGLIVWGVWKILHTINQLASDPAISNLI